MLVILLHTGLLRALGKYFYTQRNQRTGNGDKKSNPNVVKALPERYFTGEVF